MLNNNNYYPAILKKAITAFGLLFSDIRIERTNSSNTLTQNGLVSQLINVPISYAPKEKWLTRIDSEPDLKNNTSISLPRMVFEITGYSYDAIRKINKLNKITKIVDNKLKTQYSPVPYNLDISLYLVTKSVEDGFAVMEQILPIFTPDYTLNIKVIPDMDIINLVPVILNNVSVEDTFEDDFIANRIITHTFNFSMKLNLFGAIKEQLPITKVNVNLNDPSSSFYVKVENDIVQEEWIEQSDIIPSFFN